MADCVRVRVMRLVVTVPLLLAVALLARSLRSLLHASVVGLLNLVVASILSRDVGVHLPDANQLPLTYERLVRRLILAGVKDPAHQTDTKPDGTTQRKSGGRAETPDHREREKREPQPNSCADSTEQRSAMEDRGERAGLRRHRRYGRRVHGE
jgi:hypothetical protein